MYDGVKNGYELVDCWHRVNKRLHYIETNTKLAGLIFLKLQLLDLPHDLNKLLLCRT